MPEPKPNKIPELMSIDQLAQRLGITVRHVRRLVAEKRVPYYKVGRLVPRQATFARFETARSASWSLWRLRQAM
jgi:excisionase family DNA binding protein